MLAKFRVYIFLISCSGLIFFGLYKILNEEERAATYEKHTKSSRTAVHISQPSLHPMKNVNELLHITQPPHHLKKQRLREAEVHAKIRNQALKRANDLQQIVYASRNPVSNSEILDPTSFPANYAVKNHSSPGRRIVHLDLKGAPMIVNYYGKLFPQLRTLGATGLLIEYEDMFPYWGSIKTFSAHNAYNKAEIQQIVMMAQANNLEIIPLVQTFGHLEFVLKQLEFSDLREVTEYPQVLCPSRNQSQEILKEMISQVLKLHPGSKWLHIGADEVYYIGRCPKCQARMRDEGITTDTLFLNHVQDIARYVKEKYKVQPIMWDDMFRDIPADSIKATGIADYVEPMVWKYTPNLDVLTPEMWRKYGSLFSGVWVASAFKGATGPKQILPKIPYHLENHYSWLITIRSLPKQVNFRGIALTGWQRYDHFAALCELLPASLPSLAINLLYLQKGVVDDALIDRAKDILKCSDEFNVTWNYLTEEVICKFPGAKVFKGVQHLVGIRLSLDKIRKNNHVVGWMSDSHVRTNFGSPAHVEIGTKDLGSLITNVTLLYTMLENMMPEVYDRHTIREWMEQFVDPILKEIKEIKQKVEKLVSRSTWPRRPLEESPVQGFKELANLNRHDL